MTRILTLALLLIASVAQAAEPPRVTNLRGSASESEVQLKYDISGPVGRSVEIIVEMSRDGGRSWQRAKGLSGDHGPGVRAGRGKSVSWDPYQTFPGYRGRLQFQVRTRAEKDYAPRLTVNATPGDATIRILNIRDPYRPGMALKPGRYQVQLSKSGYQSQTQWVQLDQERTLYVTLKKIERQPFEPELVSIQGGCFQMGSPGSEPGRRDDERQHRVCLKAFQMARHEVTQAQWRTIMGSNPSSNSGCDRCPVENVSWTDAQDYIRKLNARTGKNYRLPTEAEWEYAARAGTTTASHWGSRASHEHANYGKDECCGGLARGRDRWEKTSPVGSFPPNPWGLYDTLGNVREWTCSVYDKNYGGAEQRCTSAAASAGRAFRGDSWFGSPRGLRAAVRFGGEPSYRVGNLGFRLARDARD